MHNTARTTSVVSDHRDAIGLRGRVSVEIGRIVGQPLQA